MKVYRFRNSVVVVIFTHIGGNMAIRSKDANRLKRIYPYSRTPPRTVFVADSEDDLGANFSSTYTTQTWPALYEAEVNCNFCFTVHRREVF